MSARLRQPCFCPSLSQEAPHISPSVHPGPFLPRVLLTCQSAGCDYSQSRLAPGGTQGRKPPALRRGRIPLKDKTADVSVLTGVAQRTSVRTVNSSSWACERSSSKAGILGDWARLVQGSGPAPSLFQKASRSPEAGLGMEEGPREASWERGRRPWRETAAGWGGGGAAPGLTGNKQEAELCPQPPGEGGRLGAEGGIMFLREESPPHPSPSEPRQGSEQRGARWEPATQGLSPGRVPGDSFPGAQRASTWPAGGASHPRSGSLLSPNSSGPFLRPEGPSAAAHGET